MSGRRRTAYRYTLTRVLADAAHPRTVLFVMLNPSTADARRDDPTIRRCIGFARTWGFGRLRVANLYAARATRPADLFRLRDPVGPRNAAVLATELSAADRVIAAWGHHGRRDGRGDALRAAFPDIVWWCLGTTQHGEPRHPLYVRKDRRPERLR